jgi:DNA transposition AAA+ family ATPase
MPDADVSAVVQKFAAFMEAKGLSQADAAKSISVSPGTLNQVLAGKYKGKTARIEEKMSRALEHSDRRAQRPLKPPIVETSVYQRVVKALQMAQDEGCMAAILGPSQVGKTSAAKHYCADEPETIYVVLHPNGHNGRQRSVRPLMMKVAEALHITLAQSAGNDEWLEMVGAKLRGSNRLVIIDQADLADENILQTLRTIWDLSQVGMVLLGTTDLLDSIRRKNSPTLNQVLRRIAYCEVVDGLTEEDAEKMLESFKLDDTSILTAHDGAHGIAGRLALGIAGAQRLAKETGKPLDSKVIGRAFSKLMPEVRSNGE